MILLDLGARAIVAGIRHRVAHEAIGAHFDERRLRLFARAGGGASGRLIDREHVHAVNELRSHAVGASLLRHVAQRHGTLEGRAHAVLIVFADVDAWQLPKLRHVQRLVKDALIDRRLAKIDTRHLIRTLVLRRKRNPRRQRNLPADNRVPAEKMVVAVEQVHRAAFAGRAAASFAKQFRHHFVGRSAACERVPVIAVTSHHIIIRAERRN